MCNKSACNLYIEELDAVGVNLLSNCVCGQPIGKHLRDPRPSRREGTYNVLRSLQIFIKLYSVLIRNCYYPAVHLFKYLRPSLASYHPSILIGNLQETVNEVENLLFEYQRKGKTDITKENLPFFCIVNPPRHGKSLFLDSIFKDRSDIRVVPMTYNNNSNLTDVEMHSPRHALFNFWLRFICSVTGDSLTYLQQTLLDSHHPIGGFKEVGVEYTLDWAKEIILQRYNRNPFVDAESKRQLPLIIAVDEFSKLTDRMKEKKWQKEKVLEFFGKLSNEKRLDPLIQFVFTGFNKEMVRESGAQFKCMSLTLCDFSSSKPLLREIVRVYRERKVTVPMLLYETVKSTPGLVGLWAERVFTENAFDFSLAVFKDNLQWIKNVCDLEIPANKTTSPAQENWSLIVEYLKLSEEVDGGETLEERKLVLGNKLVSNLIGVIQRTKRTDAIETTLTLPSPFCFVCIVCSRYEPVDALEKELMDCIKVALQCCEARPAWNLNGKNDGVHFGNFVTESLTARIITRKLGAPSDGWATFPFNCLFPADVSSVVNAQSPIDDMSYSLHGIASKSSLAKMLTSPLYYLFPLGLDELDREEADSPSGIISDLVQGAASDHRIPNFPVLCYSERCATPIQVVSKVLLDSRELNLSTEEENILSHSTSAPTGARKEVQQIWDSMQGWIKIIMDNYMTCSIFPLANGAAGCDLVLLCRDAIKPDTYHFVAVELKDSRSTKSKDWWDKLNLLKSCRCIVPRLRTMFAKENKALEYHIVFAGRE